MKSHSPRDGTISAHDLVEELKQRKPPFYARQNSQDASFYVSIGGPRAKLDHTNFAGMVLFHPTKGLAYGVSPQATHAFRELVMQYCSEAKKWHRRKGIPGRGDTTTDVEVWCELEESKQPTATCKCGDGFLRVVFDCFRAELQCKNDTYNWNDVDKFLANFERFCNQLT